MFEIGFLEKSLDPATWFDSMLFLKQMLAILISIAVTLVEHHIPLW